MNSSKNSDNEVVERRSREDSLSRTTKEWIFELTYRHCQSVAPKLKTSSDSLRTIRLSSRPPFCEDGLNKVTSSSTSLDSLFLSNSVDDLNERGSTRPAAPTCTGWYFSRESCPSISATNRKIRSGWGIGSREKFLISLTYRFRASPQSKKAIVFREVYNLEQDVLDVHPLSNIKIPGSPDSDFSAIRILLRSKQQPQSQSYTYKQNSFNDKATHLEYDSHGIPLPPWSCNEKSTNDQEEGKNDEYENVNFGPVVIFALSQQQQRENANNNDVPPALLWKVQIPPSHNESLFLESITMLDGKLITCKKNYDNYNNFGNMDPTHIYINGYQSWSFAGTVQRSFAQPTSAMPDMFSKAFNSGAILPSHPTIHANDTSMLHYICPSDKTTCGLCCLEKQKTDNNKNETSDESDDKDSRSLLQHDEYNTNDAVNEEDENLDNTNYHDLAFYKSDFFTCITSSPTNQGGYDVQLDEQGPPALVLGWLSQQHQFGMITADKSLQRLAMHCSFGDDGIHLVSRIKQTYPDQDEQFSCNYYKNNYNLVETDWGYCQVLTNTTKGSFSSRDHLNIKNDDTDYDEEPLSYYYSNVAAYNKARPFVAHQNYEPSVGWCSWYHYYDKISANTLIDNFERLNSLRLLVTPNVAIIDDGYMTAWGDWDSLKPKEFLNYSTSSDDTPVLKILSNEIRKAGMKPGIWLAPYACDKHSVLAKQHPDWIIRNHRGRPANSANCGKFFYGLDATNPEVRQHAFRTVQRAVQQWGYETLKLDFLYAACLPGTNKHDCSLSRAETMYLALQTLRDAAGEETFLIGCGCPLGPAVGFADGMRISADTGPTFYPEFPLPKWDNGTLPSLRAMIRNSLTRSGMGHRWWHNDPDCILLGETTKLTDLEVISAATVVAMTGGMMLLSDDLLKLSTKRLSIGTRIYPVTGTTAVPMDLHCPNVNNTTGLPSLLRFWCTDNLQELNNADNKNEFTRNTIDVGSNSSALITARRNSSYCAMDRSRTCLPVASGLGTWSVVSMSNWQSVPAIINVPIDYLTTFPWLSNANDSDTVSADNGYHVFAFWSKTYIWLPKTTRTFMNRQQMNSQVDMLSKMLNEHESEIFHVKSVTPTIPQYIGSDIHFSCGYEILDFKYTSNELKVRFKNYVKRSGYVYIYIPLDGNENSFDERKSLEAIVNNRTQEVDEIYSLPLIDNGDVVRDAGRVVRVFMEIPGNNVADDACIILSY